MERHVKLIGQKDREFAESLSGVDCGLGVAPEGTLEALGLQGFAVSGCLFWAEPLHPVAVCRAKGGKLLKNPGFIVAIGRVKATGDLVFDTSGVQEFEPKLAAAQCGVQTMSSRLTDGPDHAEVADAGTKRARIAIKNSYAFALAGGNRSVGQANDT